MRVLAHRGMWKTKADQNSIQAIDEAFRQGFGVEFDVRDSNGTIVVSHDPPLKDAETLENVLRATASMAQADRLVFATNIKSDGIAAQCGAIFKQFGCESFYFDMSVPDMRAYIAGALQTYTRESDVEPEPAYYADAVGVWLDELEGDWMSPADIDRHLDNGKRVAVVSRELHGRPHVKQWEMLSRYRGSEDVFLCTDHPSLAREYFAS